jgi:hypothetical protein
MHPPLVSQWQPPAQIGSGVPHVVPLTASIAQAPLAQWAGPFELAPRQT